MNAEVVKRELGYSDKELSALQEEFLENGYVILKNAIDHQQIDEMWGDVEKNMAENPKLTFSLYGEILNNDQLSGELMREGESLRIIDIETHSELARGVILHQKISQFLSSYYENLPSAIQTLTYKYSSQQGAHTDLHLVSPLSVGLNYPRDSLVAAWIACEDSDETNGALIIYPGSHRFYKQSFDDFGKDYAAWVEYLIERCHKFGVEPDIFRAKKGDILIWHGDFVHAGGIINQPGKTRKSVVAHYASLASDHQPAVKELKRIGSDRGWLYVKEDILKE